MAESGKPLIVRCPSCAETVPYRTDNPYRPFCSKGCKALDLGAWASEQFRVDARPTTEDLQDDAG
ncbi:MAG: DNA gyrase inhibitor YacG [Chitinophagaceae bacterium]|nr:MAG: DNA gyrase inhibitor YacG [Chitinophagaceae bacterium]